MIANRVAVILGGLLSWITLPISILTNLGGGCLVTITFGLILLPLSLIWMVFMGLLLSVSWAWERVPWPLQVLLAVPGIPIAAIGYAYVLMIPEEPESRRSKILLCLTFPYEMDLLRYRRLHDDEKRLRERGETHPLDAAFQNLPPHGDPGYAEAYRSVQAIYDVSITEAGLGDGRYDRIANLLAVLGRALGECGY